MPAKTIYVRDEEQWNRAKRLAGEEGLSALIGQLLDSWAAKREASVRLEKGDYAEIQLWVGGDEHRQQHSSEPHQVAFTGRLLVDSDEFGSQQLPRVQVYQSKKGALIVYRDWRGATRQENATYLRFENLDALSRFPAALSIMWGLDHEGKEADCGELHRSLLTSVAAALGELAVFRID